jgi:hypothetical protein
MKFAVEMGSSAMTYIPSFIKTVSGILKFFWEGVIQTHSMEIAYAYFNCFKIRKTNM